MAHKKSPDGRIKTDPLLFIPHINNSMEPTPLEQQFLDVYGSPTFERIQDFVLRNDILDFYLKSRHSSRDLFDFGLHYGVIEIVAFCYCHLKVSVDINNVVSGYYKAITSSPDTIDSDEATPVYSENGGNAGLIVGTIDKFTPSRLECIRFMIRMKKFSKYNVEKGKFIYTIVDKYVKSHRLLEVY